MRFNELLKDDVLRDGAYIQLEGNVDEKDARTDLVMNDVTRMQLYDAYGNRTVNGMASCFSCIACGGVCGRDVSMTIRSSLVITLL